MISTHFHFNLSKNLFGEGNKKECTKYGCFSPKKKSSAIMLKIISNKIQNSQKQLTENAVYICKPMEEIDFDANEFFFLYVAAAV